MMPVPDGYRLEVVQPKPDDYQKSLLLQLDLLAVKFAEAAAPIRNALLIAQMNDARQPTYRMVPA